MEITTKKEQEDRHYKYFREREEKNKRIDRLFGAIELAILGLTIALCCYNWQLAIVSLIWFFVNGVEYSRGCTWLCIDEIDMPDSALGLRIMFKSWKVLLPMLAVGVILVLVNYPIIALVYGMVVVCVLYPLMSDLFVLNF